MNCLLEKYQVYFTDLNSLVAKIDEGLDKLLTGNNDNLVIQNWALMNVSSQMFCVNKYWDMTNEKQECLNYALDCLGIRFKDFLPYYWRPSKKGERIGIGYWQIDKRGGQVPPFTVGPIIN